MKISTKTRTKTNVNANQTCLSICHDKTQNLRNEVDIEWSEMKHEEPHYSLTIWPHQFSRNISNLVLFQPEKTRGNNSLEVTIVRA